MKLHLDHIPADPGFRITSSDGLFLTGSCFTHHIEQKLQNAGFDPALNPAGILFNPLSIASELSAIVQGSAPETSHFVSNGTRWFSYHAHSSLQAESKEELLEKISATQNIALQKIKQTQVLFITFGSAYYYHHKDLNIIVGNCHKQAQQNFEKKLASPQQIVDQYKLLLPLLHAISPHMKIVFTVSPVRHLRDGLIENTLSKSTLQVAIHQLLKETSNCYYFPAYELVAEDLKDYRFYEADLMHPNRQAIDYVWQKFKSCYFDQKTQELVTLQEAYSKAKAHRPSLNDPQELEKFESHLITLQTRIKNF